jgi:SAM-dependent methyltransferase
MSPFKKYARYYDLLYRDKDYSGETQYVHNLIRSQCAGARTILNLGCGSGRHDRRLAEYGYVVTGVDISDEMLSEARQAAAGKEGLKYVLGDLCTVRLTEKFDAVIALFHVMSYQITNDDLLKAFATANYHLKENGVFIFDCWYGPGVLTDRPVVRIREIEDELVSITRIAKPVTHPNDNVVDVNYLMFIREKSSSNVHEIRELHRMRYLFGPEVKYLLSMSGLVSDRQEEWMTGETLGSNCWNAVFICRKLEQKGNL